MNKNRVIGIMSAMPEEINGVVRLVQNPETKTVGGRLYTSGIINGKNVVVVFSRWGKVAAASTVTTLIELFNVDEIIFTGIAGGIHHDLNVGDIVIASSCVFHDMDTRPLNDRYVVPLLNKKFFELNASDTIIEKLQDKFSQKNIIDLLSLKWLEYFNLNAVKVVCRAVASGDQFVNSDEVRNDLIQNLPEVACVEMEGAAVSQVCFEHTIPCVIVRTISDSANQTAAIDFEPFANHVASNYSVAIVGVLLSD